MQAERLALLAAAANRNSGGCLAQPVALHCQNTPFNPAPLCLACPHRNSLALQLVMHSLHLQLPLPDIQPGALPRLQIFLLKAPSLQTMLPASWGASPDVLPALQTLTLTASFVEQLAPDWAHGFRQLTTLVLAVREDVAGGSPVAAVPRLPLEWASGFPALTWLSLSVPVVAGPIPLEWLEGGSPELVTL
jgi:hypothetical protein